MLLGGSVVFADLVLHEDGRVEPDDLTAADAELVFDDDRLPRLLELPPMGGTRATSLPTVHPDGTGAST